MTLTWSGTVLIMVRMYCCLAQPFTNLLFQFKLHLNFPHFHIPRLTVCGGQEPAEQLSTIILTAPDTMLSFLSQFMHYSNQLESINEGTKEPGDLCFLDALASLDFKLSVTKWVTFLQLAHLEGLSDYFSFNSSLSLGLWLRWWVTHLYRHFCPSIYLMGGTSNLL